MRLIDDPGEGVDAMLEYLYTFESPNFEGSPCGSHVKAEGAFIMGDKYDLGPLKELGRKKLLDNIQTSVRGWQSNPDQIDEEVQRLIINAIARLWTLQQDGSDSLREECLEYLCTIPGVIRDSHQFQTLVNTNSAFRNQFVRHILSTMDEGKQRNGH